MAKCSVCEYGKQIKVALVDIDQTHNWLIGEVRTRTGLYFDRSYLNKVLTGKCAPQKIIATINEILGLEPPEQPNTQGGT